MGSFLRQLAFILLWGMGLALAAQSLVPAVQERKLPNGFRILLVERPGSGAFHARLFLQGGSASTGFLPAAASELLAHCLFHAPIEGTAVDPKLLEELLKREEGTFEALRLAGIRHARQPGSAEEVPGLELLHRQTLTTLRTLAENAPRLDPLAALGGRRAEIRVEADQIAFGLDLPKEGLPGYCRTLAGRLKTLTLARFPLERELLLQRLDTDADSERKALDVLLGASLAGHPYAQTSGLRRETVEAITWSDLRAYARWAAAPERLVLVLVGDLRMAEAVLAAEPTFGTLRGGETGWGHRNDLPVELPEGPGALRLQASLRGEKRLYVSWRVPPMTHPDHQALRVLVQMLGGGVARLPSRLAGLAKSLSVRLGVPGGRDANLLVVEASPIERRGLAEMEQVVQGEVIRLQRGAFQEGEIRRAQRQVEVDQLAAQEDAGGFAHVVGSAVCQGGDWNLAFRALQLQRDFTQQEIQGLALKYLTPSRSAQVFLEPDPILMPVDALEARTAKVLSRILAAKLDDPGRVDAVVRDALRQLRMMPLREREQTLNLLEAQVKP